MKSWNVHRVRKDAISITVDFSLRAATAYPASLIESFLFFPSLTPGVREGKKRVFFDCLFCCRLFLRRLKTAGYRNVTPFGVRMNASRPVFSLCSMCSLWLIFFGGRRRPRTSCTSVFFTFSRFLEAAAASVHQLITLRTSRTLREASFAAGDYRAPAHPCA